MTIENYVQTDVVQEAKVEISENEVIYNPDETSPLITISTPQEIDYTNDKDLVIDYAVSDFESGIEDENWQVEKDGEKLDWTEKNVDLSLEHLGKYIFKVSAVDNAGNSGEKSAEFRITTSLDAIQNNLLHYFNLGLIKNKIIFKFFRNEMENLERLFELLEKTENSELDPGPRKVAVGTLKTVINADIEMIVRQLNRKSPQWIDREAAKLLIESLDAIKLK